MEYHKWEMHNKKKVSSTVRKITVFGFLKLKGLKSVLSDRVSSSLYLKEFLNDFDLVSFSISNIAYCR